MRLEEAAAILGVSVDASVETLKQSYRKLALHWHPDKVSLISSDILHLKIHYYYSWIYNSYFMYIYLYMYIFSVENQMQKKNSNNYR